MKTDGIVYLEITTSRDEGKPIDHFEAGKWYKWVGPKERPNFWNSDGYMDYMLDGKPHLCTNSHSDNAKLARFAEDNKCPYRAFANPGFLWAWYGIEFFREVPATEERSVCVGIKDLEKRRNKAIVASSSCTTIMISLPLDQIPSREAIRRRLLGL